MTSPHVLVVGSSNADFIMGLERLPDAGETVTDGHFCQTFGGKGANQAVAAARSGGKVTFIAGVGDDDSGRQMRHNFERDGIETCHIVRVSDMPSGTALVMFDQEGRNYLSVAPGANYAMQPHHLSAGLFNRADVVVLPMEILLSTTLRALELATMSNTPVVFNYAPIKNREVPVCAAMTLLVVNEVEAAALCDRSVQNPTEALLAARALHAQGPQVVVVTLGAGGVVWFSDEGAGQMPSFAVKACDTTAAGDTFCGALAVAWAQKRGLCEAIRFACGAAALSVTRMGAQPSIPWQADVEAFLGGQGVSQ